jgi:hypothetical protein
MLALAARLWRKILSGQRRSYTLTSALDISADACDGFKFARGEIGIGNLDSKFLLDGAYHVRQGERVQQSTVEQGIVRAYLDGLFGDSLNDAGYSGL